MGYCISVCIEKGGVGKTVTVCNLAALMAQDGKRVLVVDMDAQGNCTYTLTGARVTDNTFDRAGVYDMFRAYGISGTQNYISRTQFDNIDIIPANGNTPMAAKQLQILEQCRKHQYQYVFGHVPGTGCRRIRLYFDRYPAVPRCNGDQRPDGQ